MGGTADKEKAEEEIFGKPGDFKRTNIANAKKGRMAIGITGITTTLENRKGGCGLKTVQYPLDTQAIEEVLNCNQDPCPSIKVSLSKETVAELSKMAIMLEGSTESTPLKAHLVFNEEDNPEKIVYASLVVKG